MIYCPVSLSVIKHICSWYTECIYAEAVSECLCIVFIDHSDSASVWLHVSMTAVICGAKVFNLLLILVACVSVHTALIYVSVLQRAGVFGVCMCASMSVLVCFQAQAVRLAWMSERAINTRGGRNTQTPALDCIYVLIEVVVGGVITHSSALVKAGVQQKHQGC